VKSLREVIIKHDIVSEELKAVVTMDIVLAQISSHTVFNGDDGLDDDVVDLGPHEVEIDSVLF
jgi:hypothetical protein